MEVTQINTTEKATGRTSSSVEILTPRPYKAEWHLQVSGRGKITPDPQVGDLHWMGKYLMQTETNPESQMETHGLL